jgi:chemotaxis protein MotA
VDDEHAFYQVLRVALVSFIKGLSPIMAMEMARRTIPGHVRPSFQEVEKTCRSSSGGGDKAAAA